MRVPWLVAVTGNAAQYESKIAGFERKGINDGDVVLFGSSSLRLWTTAQTDLAPLPVVNRGFGGGHAAHLSLFWQRIVGDKKPAAVVVYAGDNDLASGKAVDVVYADLCSFLSMVRGRVPVVLLLVKRSPQRAHLDDAIVALDLRLRALAGDDVVIVDADAALWGGDRPRSELFQWDGLHLSPAGYARWTEAVRPVLLALQRAP